MTDQEKIQKLEKENERLRYFFAYCTQVEAQRDNALNELARLQVQYNEMAERFTQAMWAASFTE